MIVEKSNLIDSNKVAELLNMDKYAFKKIIKKHQDEITFLYIDKKYFFTNEEVERMLKNQERNIPINIRITEGLITQKEFCEKYRIDLKSISYFFYANAERIGNKNYLREEQLIEYLDRKNEYKVIKHNSDWINVANLPGREKTHVDKLLEDGVYTEQTKVYKFSEREIVFIHKNLYNDIKHKDEAIKHEYEAIRQNDEWIDVASLGINVRAQIKKLAEDGAYTEEIKVYKFSGKKIFINKKLYNELKVQGYKNHTRRIFSKFDINSNCNHLFDLNYLKKVINDILSQNMDIIGKKIYKLEEVVEVTDISKNEIIEQIKINNLDKYINVTNDSINMYEGGVRKLLRLNSYVSVQEISKITRIHQTSLLRNANIIIESNKDSKVYFQKNTYINKDLALEVLKCYLKSKSLKSDNVNDLLKKRIMLIDTPYKVTLALAIRYLKEKIDKLKSSTAMDKKGEIRNSIKSIEILLNSIQKELPDHSNEEIEEVILNTELKSGCINAMTFINFVSDSLKEKCKYTRKFGKSFIKQFNQENSDKKSDEVYTEYEWSEYYLFLSNIDTHILKAFEDERYAQVWLYCLLHLSITWRSKDIINKIPNISLEIVNIYDFEWFKSGNSFTFVMALQILKFVAFSLDGEIAYKNKMNLHFNIPLSLKISTAVALILNEIHRRKANKANIFYSLKITHPTVKNDYIKFFAGKPYLERFSNIKATRTLMSFSFATAIRSVGMAGVAYTLMRYSRSHKEEVGKITNTTALYFHFENIDGNPSDVAYQTIERGMFGFLYVKLIEIAITEEKLGLLSQDNLTELVKDIQKEINPITVERLSEQLLENRKDLDLGINIINTLEKAKGFSKQCQQDLIKIVEDNIEKRYIEVAKDLFPEEGEKFHEYIKKSCKKINQILNDSVSGGDAATKILNDIRKGYNNGYTSYSNCLFDEIEIKKKCPFIVPETCIGCKFNILNIMQLYEVSGRLNLLLDKMLNNDYLGEIELIKNTSLMHSYLYIMIQAKVQYEKIDRNILTVFFNEKEIKSKINKLQSLDRILYLK